MSEEYEPKPETPESRAVADAMLRRIEMGGGTSFVELMQACEEAGVPAKGNVVFYLPDYPSIVMWGGVSEAFLDGFDLLRKSGEVEPRASSQLVYLLDGMMLNYPVAKRPPKNGYKEDHWLPMVFWTKEQIARLGMKPL